MPYQRAQDRKEIGSAQTYEVLQAKNAFLEDSSEYLSVQSSYNKENLDAAELNLKISREKYRNGTINSFNFRDVQQLHQNAAYRYQRAVFNVIQSYHTLLRLTGGIIEEYE